MSFSKPPDDPQRMRIISVERFEQLLAAYGATSEHWPETERSAAQRLLDESAAARRLLAHAAALDALLDRVTSEPPSPLLRAQVLMAAPRAPRRRLAYAMGVAVPLAVAAAVILWLVSARQPADRVAVVTDVQVGEYTSPTDVLLRPFGVDISGTWPSIGCSASILECPDMEMEAGGESYSRRVSRRSMA